MSLSRAFVLLCAVLALSACGSSKGSQPAEEQQVVAAPSAIEAIDEPAPDAGFGMPPDDAGASSEYHCFDKTIAEEKRSPIEKMMRCDEDFPPALPS